MKGLLGRRAKTLQRHQLPPTTPKPRAPTDPKEILLLASIPVTDNDFVALAADRAKAVRAYILANGQDRSRAPFPDGKPVRRGKVRRQPGLSAVQIDCHVQSRSKVRCRNSSMTDDQISRFERYTQQQRFDAAFDVCTEAILDNGADWNAIYLAGICLRFQGDSVGAIGHYQRALQLNQDVAPIWIALGIALQSLGRFPDAINALSTDVHLDPNSYASHNSLGLTYKLAGDYNSAIVAYEAALQVCANRAYAEVRHRRPDYFRVEQRGDSSILVIDRAYMEVMRQILATDFDYFNTVKNMVTCCIEMGDHSRATELQDHADTCTPIDADIIGPIQPRK